MKREEFDYANSDECMFYQNHNNTYINIYMNENMHINLIWIFLKKGKNRNKNSF